MRASGGLPNSRVKKRCCSWLGLPRFRLKPTTLPSWLTRYGLCRVPCCTWKPVTCPIAWQFDGQLAAGRGAGVSPTSLTPAQAAAGSTRQATATIVHRRLTTSIQHEPAAVGADAYL